MTGLTYLLLDIASKVWSIDHWVRFRLIIGEYQNIMDFLLNNNILFLSEINIDFNNIPLFLHGNGKSKNLLEYLSNNNENLELIIDFLNYYFVFIIQAKYYYTNENLFFEILKNTTWQNSPVIIYNQPITTTTTTTSPKILELTFDDIINANTLVGDASNVVDWNTFFGFDIDSSLYTTIFSSVIVSGNTVYLYGGLGITLKTLLFGNNNNLLRIIDQNSIVAVGDTALGYCGVIEISLPVCKTTYYDSINGWGYGSFGYNYYLTTIYLPKLEVASYYCFYYCPLLTSIYLPSLTYAGEFCFYYCSSITSFNLPKLNTAGDYCFSDCTLANSFDLPSCTNLGTTFKDDAVFYDR